MALPPLIAVDFDGVLHTGAPSYSTHTIDGTITREALDWLYAATQQAVVVVHSARLAKPGPAAQAIVKALDDAAIRHYRETGRMISPLRLAFTGVKPPAVAFIDDRAIRFNGDWSDPALAVEAILTGKTHEGR